jgi:hypothetical protein
MRVLIDECEWQQRQYQLIFVELAMMNINAANDVSTQSSKQYYNSFISEY